MKFLWRFHMKSIWRLHKKIMRRLRMKFLWMLHMKGPYEFHIKFIMEPSYKFSYEIHKNFSYEFHMKNEKAPYEFDMKFMTRVCWVNLISMCFVRFDNCLFSAMWIAEMLSSKIVIGEPSEHLKSWRMLLSHMASCADEERAMYSASAVERATHGCLLLDQEIAEPFFMKA